MQNPFITVIHEINRREVKCHSQGQDNFATVKTPELGYKEMEESDQPICIKSNPFIYFIYQVLPFILTVTKECAVLFSVSYENDQTPD